MDRFIYMNTRWEKWVIWTQFAIFLALIGLIGVTAAKAGELEGSVGVGQSIYTNHSDADWNLRATLGHTDLPVYAVAGYDTPRVKMLGQPLAETDMLSLGLGVKRELVSGFTIFTEVGYTWLNLDVNREPYDVQREIIYTQLLLNHDVAGRPVPTGPRGYQTTYEADDAIFWRLGLRYDLYEHVSLTAAYRALYTDTQYSLRSGDWEDGDGYWREDETYNLSSFEVGVEYRF